MSVCHLEFLDLSGMLRLLETSGLPRQTYL
jgi:hypothetical protein